MSTLKTTFSNLQLSNESTALLNKAMAELEVDEYDKAKSVIKDRLLEIKRLEIMLERAKTELADLLTHDQSEILMLSEGHVSR
jgi:hypothetical protein